MAKVNITISADVSGLLDDLRFLSAFIKMPECPPEAIQSVILLLDFPDEAICIDSDLDTTGATDHLVVRFKPSDCLASLVSALRARDVDRSVV